MKATNKIAETGWWLTPVHGPDFCDADWAVFHLEDRHARLVRDARSGLQKLQATHGGWGSTTLRGRLTMVVLTGITEERLLELFPALPQDEIEEEGPKFIGPDFDPGKLAEDEVWRSECHGLRVYDNAVYAVAIDKYTSATVESDDLEVLFA
jgi:hypothetical protein